MRENWSEMVIGIFIILTFVTYQEATALTENATESTTIKTLTSFSCEGRVTGYYADVETGCRTYHYCIGNQQYTYECPNNTLFQQRIFICNHWYLVNCDTSEQFYNANLLIGQQNTPFVGEDDAPLPQTRPGPRPTSEPSFTKEPTYYEDYTRGKADIELTETISTTATSAPATSRAEAALVGKANDDERLIRLKFADPRGLFYIPNGNNSVETLKTSFREFLIPSITKEEVIQFNVNRRTIRNFQCPKFCDFRYVRPGTCHPCILIK